MSALLPNTALEATACNGQNTGNFETWCRFYQLSQYRGRRLSSTVRPLLAPYVSWHTYLRQHQQCEEHVTMDDPATRNAQLRTEAEQLLTSGLLDVLARYGIPHVAGSYALGLMVWRDLDLYLETKQLSLTQFFMLGGDLANLLTPIRMSFRNERIARTPGLPHGLYWGVYLGNGSHGAWKIDVWAIEPEQYQALSSHQEAIADTLTPETRRTILNIKAAIWNKPDYRRTFSSQDVYQAVLQHDVTTLDEFWNYVRQKGE